MCEISEVEGRSLKLDTRGKAGLCREASFVIVDVPQDMA